MSEPVRLAAEHGQALSLEVVAANPTANPQELRLIADDHVGSRVESEAKTLMAVWAIGQAMPKGQASSAPLMAKQNVRGHSPPFDDLVLQRRFRRLRAAHARNLRARLGAKRLLVSFSI